jgi:hypothetical protein
LQLPFYVVQQSGRLGFWFEKRIERHLFLGVDQRFEKNWPACINWSKFTVSLRSF